MLPGGTTVNRGDYPAELWQFVTARRFYEALGITYTDLCAADPDWVATWEKMILSERAANANRQEIESFHASQGMKPPGT